MKPLISCILATRDRRRFAQQAIRLFLRQTYDPAELVVVDDGEDAVGDLCEGLVNVRYVRAARGTTLGAKLNQGVRVARGPVLQKLDDDDYYHSGFLAAAAAQLAAAPASHFVAWDCFAVLLRGQARLRFSGHGWAAGGTLCFHRDSWERMPFRDEPCSVDSHFIRDHGRRVHRVCAPEMYVLVRHGGNTWRESSGRSVDEQLRRLPVFSVPLDSIIEPLDRPFYAALLQAH